jgi:hypothetical protein
VGFLRRGPNQDHVTRVYCDLLNASRSDESSRKMAEEGCDVSYNPDFPNRHFDEAIRFSLARYGPEVVAAAVEKINAESREDD